MGFKISWERGGKRVGEWIIKKRGGKVVQTRSGRKEERDR